MLNAFDDGILAGAGPSACADRFVGPTSDFVRAEIVRLGAPPDEVEAALAFADRRGLDIRAYQGMSPRMRRLVDLVGVAGRAITVSAYAACAGDPVEA